MSRLRLVGEGETGRKAGDAAEAEVLQEPRGSAPSRPARGPTRPPGPIPLELARMLRRGEAVVWWGEKDRISWAPVLWTALGGLLFLAGASAFAPGLWSGPIDEAWQPVAVVLSPALFIALREALSLRKIAVTDTSVIALPRFGSADRIAFRNVDRVSTDLLTGGVLLSGAAHKVRVPPLLMEDTRAAIATQTRNAIRSGDGPDDPLGWLPL